MIFFNGVTLTFETDVFTPPITGGFFMEIFDSDYSVAEDIIRGLSLDELVHAKNDNPNDTFWGEYIEIKKEQMGLCDLGRSISLDQPEILNEVDRVRINCINKETELTVNGNTPSSLRSQVAAFPTNKIADASPVGHLTVASLQDRDKGLSAAGLSGYSNGRVPINTNAKDFFHYLKIDWFDNGKSTKGIRINAQHKVKIQFKFDEDSDYNECTGKICAENRSWKRTIDIENPFYAGVFEWYQDFALEFSSSNGYHYTHKPRLGHVYIDNKTRIDEAAIMFFKVEFKPTIIKLWVDGTEHYFELDDESPSGQDKCKSLKARYFFKGQSVAEKKSPVSFKAAFGK